MEATTIDQLFPDVLEEIFSYLSVRDLKHCTLVCKYWNEVIGSSAATMKKFTLGFTLISGQKRRLMEKLEQGPDCTRSHQNMAITFGEKSLPLLPIFDRFDISQVKTLEASIGHLSGNGDIFERRWILNLLSRMPLLELLKLSHKRINIDESNVSAVTLANLKKLEVDEFGSSGFIKFIIAPNITDFKYTAEHLDDRYSGAKIDAVADFIKAKNRLVSLKVSGQLFDKLHQRHDFIGMRLESLEVTREYYEKYSDTTKKNFNKFLISNSRSLTSLSIPALLISKEMCEVIFNRLSKLTSLDIYGCVTNAVSWMENLSPNDISNNLSLKTLKVDHVAAVNGFQMILQRAPQLKKLKLGDGQEVSNVTMKVVATSAPRLVELEVFSFQILEGDHQFNELKYLKIVLFSKVNCIASLVRRCPKIEVFEYHRYDMDDPNNLIDILLQRKTLRHLKFVSFSAYFRQIVLDKLRANYGNLRSLEFRCSNGEFILFKFPESLEESLEESLKDWEVEQQEARFLKLKKMNSL